MMIMYLHCWCQPKMMTILIINDFHQGAKTSVNEDSIVVVSISYA
jgi:hypothetical protein